MLPRVFQKGSKEKEPVLVYRDRRLFSHCGVDILNLLSHSQVSGASGNPSSFLGQRLTRRTVFGFQTESQTEVKQKTHRLNHILK